MQAEAGADIVSIQQPNDIAGATLQEAILETGRKIVAFECDLADSAALRVTVQEIWKAGIVPDNLLNCAGLNRRNKIEDIPDADIDLVRRYLLCGTSCPTPSWPRTMTTLTIN